MEVNSTDRLAGPGACAGRAVCTEMKGAGGMCGDGGMHGHPCPAQVCTRARFAHSSWCFRRGCPGEPYTCMLVRTDNFLVNGQKRTCYTPIFADKCALNLGTSFQIAREFPVLARQNQSSTHAVFFIPHPSPPKPPKTVASQN
jgi:hypothetical protein